MTSINQEQSPAFCFSLIFHEIGILKSSGLLFCRLSHHLDLCDCFMIRFGLHIFDQEYHVGDVVNSWYTGSGDLEYSSPHYWGC